MKLNNNFNVLYVELVLNNCLKGTLDNTIKHQHITLAYNPTNTQVCEYLNLIEKGEINYSYEAIGYGNNGVNEGYSVLIKEAIPYYNTFKPHITTAVAEGASAVGTGNLDFQAINERFTGTCQLNIFYNDMTPEA